MQSYPKMRSSRTQNNSFSCRLEHLDYNKLLPSDTPYLHPLRNLMRGDFDHCAAWGVQCCLNDVIRVHDKRIPKNIKQLFHIIADHEQCVLPIHYMCGVRTRVFSVLSIELVKRKMINICREIQPHCLRSKTWHTLNVRNSTSPWLMKLFASFSFGKLLHNCCRCRRRRISFLLF